MITDKRRPTTMTVEMEQLKAAHRATWASGDYTAVADAFVLGVGQTAVASASLAAGTELLDVATGSGNAAIPAALAGARVTGLDLVPELLAVGADRARRAGVEIDWVERRRRGAAVSGRALRHGPLRCRRAVRAEA